MTNNITLRAGVPYSRRDGTRVMLEDRGDFLIDRDRGWLYAADNPLVFMDTSDRSYRSDIVGLYLEPGIWRTRAGYTVEVMPRDATYYDYPFMYELEGFEVTVNRLGTYLEGREKPHDIVDYVSALPPETFLHEGVWVDRCNYIVTVEFDGHSYWSRGVKYRIGSEGRARHDYMTIHDLIRPFAEGEEMPDPKSKADFARDGYIVDSQLLKPISAEWQAFLVRWLDTNDALRLSHYYDGMVSFIYSRDTNPNVIPYDATQRYLHSRYVKQNGWSFSVDAYDVKAQILRSRLQPEAPTNVVLQYTERGDEVVATLVPKHFIYGGRYHANVEPRYHNPPHMMHNQLSQTYNRLTNMYAEMEREVDKKLCAGDYQPVPEGFKTKRGTGVHMSTQNPGLLAYFPTLRHWQRRVPQQIKPGRYLRQYFPDMHDDDVRRMSGLCSPGDLRYYTDWQDMLKVYRQLADDGIVSSCMSYDKWGAMHPLMVYDNSDVELAVLYINDKPVARALYNKHNRHFPMIYGQWEKMERALYNAGFIHDSLCGARIRKLPRYVNCSRSDIDLDTIWERANGNTILMPYIDHKRDLDRSSNCSTNVDIEGDVIVIRYDDGEYSADNHENASLGDPQTQCEHCDDYVDEDELYYIEDGDIHICNYCFDHRTMRVYTNQNNFFRVMGGSANRFSYIYLSAPDVYVRDSDAAADWGYVWSDWVDDYIDEDDAVWVEDDNDWYPDNQVGKSVMWDEENGVYLTTEEYDRRMAEREQDEAA
jgi:hypothetical protein